ncbi:MAG: ribosome maturation factor RimP [Cyclobacteriaceae bacterium]|nr:ribosome maturation factor RimP [Cyclobacteriaceae bacterium]
MEVTEQIQRLAEKHLNEGQFIVEVIASLKKTPNKLIVILDGDKGVTIDDCANLSRVLSDALDKMGFLKGAYMLEVSTPGLDHPLKLNRQYHKNIGRKVRVKRADNTVEGLLVKVTEDGISVEQETGKGKKKEIKEVRIPFVEIDKTFVLVTFK